MCEPKDVKVIAKGESFTLQVSIPQCGSHLFKSFFGF